MRRSASDTERAVSPVIQANMPAIEHDVRRVRIQRETALHLHATRGEVPVRRRELIAEQCMRLGEQAVVFHGFPRGLERQRVVFV